MGWQDFAAWAVVAFALAYLGWKFVVQPRRRARGPHVSTRSIVRRARAAKATDGDCCR